MIRSRSLALLLRSSRRQGIRTGQIYRTTFGIAKRIDQISSFESNRTFHSTPPSHFPSSSNSKSATGKSGDISPIKRYDELVEKGLLRDDTHQRNVVQKLEDLHNELKTYKQRIHPEPETVKPSGWLSNLFGRSKSNDDAPDKLKIPKEVPKGLYLYGDVGTGKR